ncbi:hypothetical protein MPTK1_6g15450 [Marchantia polymorpha subsp. ruderalis]|uniref:Uncharacterized protein n=2 Tax=Marchantia polymorpha TaxID=3197 RepID=A0AAF6BSC0_MARPO|nr:hypothetical protein MARPO_0056s0057 [Marchantia polymorpha]BBN14904.1 hypothetical protein Mp_6g15450 [Marchantia polymorpha subsp. ruderalis]|eukprot:PTQ37588.1 hypothetical protein MARPO_0056s0057 [Marchantia polymorpha]
MQHPETAGTASSVSVPFIRVELGFMLQIANPFWWVRYRGRVQLADIFTVLSRQSYLFRSSGKFVGSSRRYCPDDNLHRYYRKSLHD